MNEGIDQSNERIETEDIMGKMQNLVFRDGEFNREFAKFQPEEEVDGNFNSSGLEDSFLDVSELEYLDDTNWLTEENRNGESIEEICNAVYATINDDRPDITSLCRQLESSSVTEPNIFQNQKSPIDSRTFTRPRRNQRSPLSSVIDPGNEGRHRLLRHNTTTITPSPNIIPQLRELEKTNNRPVSGNYTEFNFEDGAAESLAEVGNTRATSQPKAINIRERLEVLRMSNNLPQTPKTSAPNLHDRKTFSEDAKMVTAALRDNFKGTNSSRYLELFRNAQEYNSDDNESFLSLNLDEVSGYCDRLTLSTDPSMYSSIVKEMEQNDICIFHRSEEDYEDKTKDRRLTFGGLEIPSRDQKSNMHRTQVISCSNRTYDIDEDTGKANNTYELKNPSKHNIMNRTYDADSKPGLVDVIMQSNILDLPKNLSPKSLRENNINNNVNNNNNNRLSATCEGNNILSSTYDKFNGTLYQNELNTKQTEKYSTKVFDSSFRKAQVEKARSPTRRSNGKKDSDYSEDDCMSNTSDNSSRSFDSNTEVKSTEDVRGVGLSRNKPYFSTPNAYQKGDLHFGVMSPIRMEMGDGESRSYSNPSSRGESPRRIPAPNHQEGLQKHRMPNIRQPLKVPQRELKLKPALVRPSQKRPLSSSRTSSEPSVPQKVENCQSTASIPVLRPSGPTGVPSLTNVRPSSRTSGIPRPPTRLKQPQIRVNYSKK